MCAYYRPHTLDDALSILGQTGATVAAGCTDLFPATERQSLAGPTLDLTAIPELRGIACTQKGWRIGATTTWSDIVSADLPPAFDMLKQAAREVGSVQIQNAGTVAGNLCNASPAADGVPPLLALDALVELGNTQARRIVPLNEFLTGVRKTTRASDELLTAIHVPRHAGLGQSRFLKLGARRYLVISIAMVAVRLVLKQGHVSDLALSVGSCSEFALRLFALEKRLTGLPVTELAAQVNEAEVAAAITPISDIRADAGYRLTAATRLLQRALMDITERASE